MGDFVDDMIGRYGYPDDDGMQPDDEVVCKFCDTPYLQWEQGCDEKWRLVDAKGRIHDCRKPMSLALFPVTK